MAHTDISEQDNAQLPALAIGPALAEFTRQLVIELETNDVELPSFPEVALRVRKALTEGNSSIDEVVRLVNAEPALAVRLMRLGNSAALNPGGKRMSTVRDAIEFVGFDLARSATIAFALSHMRRAEAWRGLETQFGELWNASAELAAMSFAVARRVPHINAEQALLTGMLHTVGKLFVLTRVSRFPSLLADAGMCAEIENVWHARAARSLLIRWELSAEVVDAACNCARGEIAVDAPATLGDVLIAARYLASISGPAELASSLLLATEPFQRLGLDAGACAYVLSASAADVASLRAALED